MAIKVIAQLREVKIGKNPGKKFVMRPDLYVPITEKKVFQEAATHSGISSGVIKAAWDAAGEVIRTWPNVDVKDELKNTSIQITCLDEDGNVLKRVTSGDSGDIEDNENPSTGSGTESGTDPSAGSGTVHNGSGIIPTPTDPEDDQPSD